MYDSRLFPRRVAAIAVFLAVAIACRGSAAEPLRLDGGVQFDLSSHADSESITFLGKTTTVGALRAAGAKRRARIAKATSLGHIAFTNALGLVPGRTQQPLHVLASSSFAGYAQDYQLFCTAAQSAACLYYPSSTPLYSLGNDYLDVTKPVYDVDVNITDSSVCGDQGGTIKTASVYLASTETTQTVTACFYAYPKTSGSQFAAPVNPGVVFAESPTKCAFIYDPIVQDPHGAAKVTGEVGVGGGAMVLSEGTNSCTLSVFSK